MKKTIFFFTDYLTPREKQLLLNLALEWGKFSNTIPILASNESFKNLFAIDSFVDLDSANRLAKFSEYLSVFKFNDPMSNSDLHSNLLYCSFFNSSSLPKNFQIKINHDVLTFLAKNRANYKSEANKLSKIFLTDLKTNKSSNEIMISIDTPTKDCNLLLNTANELNCYEDDSFFQAEAPGFGCEINHSTYKEYHQIFNNFKPLTDTDLIALKNATSDLTKNLSKIKNASDEVNSKPISKLLPQLEIIQLEEKLELEAYIRKLEKSTAFRFVQTIENNLISKIFILIIHSFFSISEIFWNSKSQAPNKGR